MPLKLIIIITSNLLAIVAAVPYIRAILRGTTKPRVASWLGWGALMVVGAASAFSQHQLAAGIFLSTCSLQDFAIVILGLRYGDKRFTGPDIVCLVGALLGAAALLVLKSPVWSTAVAIVADFAALVPTLKHSYQEPEEETASAYVLEGIGSLLTLTVAGGVSFTAIAYPLYLLAADEVLAVLVMKGSRRLKPQTIGATNTARATGQPKPGSMAYPDAPVPSSDPTGPTGTPPSA